MARPTRNRRLCSPPKMIGYKPFGIANESRQHVDLTYDEYESIKLIDYDKSDQETAAMQMNISRPTFTRIYHSALNKIAKAFVEGIQIHIGGGNVKFDKTWYKCKKCYRLFENIEHHYKCEGCSTFGPDELVKIKSLNQ